MFLLSHRKAITADCRICGRSRTFEKTGPKYRAHLWILLATLGLWLPVLVALFLLDASRPYRCEGCGAEARR